MIVQKVDSTSTPAPQHTLTGHKDYVVEVRFSPSNTNILATYDKSGEVRLWGVHTGSCLHIFQCVGDGGLWENYINFSPDGKLLACRGNKVNVFRVASGQVVVLIIPARAPRALGLLLPDGAPTVRWGKTFCHARCFFLENSGFSGRSPIFWAQKKHPLLNLGKKNWHFWSIWAQ